MARSSKTRVRKAGATASGSPRLVVVTGDVTSDWNLVTIDRGHDASGTMGSSAAWNAEGATRVHWQPGGTALLGQLIEAVADPLGFSVRHAGEVVEEMDSRFRHSYAVWSRFPHAKHTDGAVQPVWRVEKFLGLDRRDQSMGLQAVARWNKQVGNAHLVILDDADLGFRDDRGYWPKVVRSPAVKPRPWVLLKMGGPVAQGKLFEHLIDSCADRLIVLTRINDLRQSEVRISRELSWERTAEDLLWELTYNSHINQLARCAHVVVSLETGGALLLSKSTTIEGEADKPPSRAVLFYDARFIESEWAQHHPGGMIGSTSCLTAGVARQIMLDSEEPDVGAGIRRGLAAMRELHLRGWQARDPNAPEDLAFPSAVVAQVLNGRSRVALAEANVPPSPAHPLRPSPPRQERPWTILADRCRGRPETVAPEIARRGVEAALLGVPVGQFGKLITVDREEIEGLRSIAALIDEYRRQRATGPLSIAVFGPPGSGKSFGVKQVAASLLHEEMQELSFNLSQLNDPAQLYGAFHQVRDHGLQGRLPLVFWDEFDTTLGQDRLGWLRHFLVPMQDGTFQQGEITHPIGRAIFVFAGGIYGSMERFRSPLTAEEGRAFRDAKGPDFVSRLKGYVDIAGPDPREGDREKDPYFLVRRAILLRCILKRDRPYLFGSEPPGELQIDSGVLRGLLEARTYRHGVRSIEAIVAMSTLAGKSRFERSSLPAEPQLDLHVDARDFIATVQELDWPEDLAREEEPHMPGQQDLFERLAEGVHVVYCEKLLDEGQVWAEPTDEYLRQQPLLQRFAGRVMKARRAKATGERKRSLVAYQNLDPDLKEQNRAFARDIPNKLDLVECIMHPVRTGHQPFEFSDEDIETLAEQEHERWMREKLQAGWGWGPKDDPVTKENPSLLPWRRLADEERIARYGAYASLVGAEELPEDVKDWDRSLVRGIPKVLAVAGYTLMKHPAEASP